MFSSSLKQPYTSITPIAKNRLSLQLMTQVLVLEQKVTGTLCSNDHNV